MYILSLFSLLTPSPAFSPLPSSSPSVTPSASTPAPAPTWPSTPTHRSLSHKLAAADLPPPFTTRTTFPHTTTASLPSPTFPRAFKKVSWRLLYGSAMKPSAERPTTSASPTPNVRHHPSLAVRMTPAESLVAIACVGGRKRREVAGPGEDPREWEWKGEVEECRERDRESEWWCGSSVETV
ncbi:hypothetical protein M427DRAFT_57900 [Gonapodya prolifera JEL478]|uniref:Ig-like domain-containing protein n=1 Tax=Gonapodya prolifera (strain JEL478) TaxID=1344416 RepID=A0A139ABE6_GONPJ|nr:hypothetical protein M427DRAFT_57900 [Gonapodya prolifera JEL478]|eukprot:KXS14126.1 hypothetical protein M427DRAFT_57900 [Gonapodya prolifera JEL478]